MTIIKQLNCKGQVLFEGIWALMLFFLAVVVTIEIIRKSQIQLILKHAVFLRVREKALGNSVQKSNLEIKKLVSTAWGKPFFRWMWSQLSIDEYFHGKLLESKAYIRYPSLFKWKDELQNPKSKHHFEATEACWFYF